MRDIRLITPLACVLLVTVRLFIGWQFLYEGMWKISTLDTPRPWTSKGYLKSSQGPFRTQFREMTGDPNELEWLDYDVMIARWDDWRDRFVAHYPDLTEQQIRKLDEMLNGPEDFRAVLEELPEGVSFPMRGIPRDAIIFNPDSKRLIIDGNLHLKASELDRIMAALARSPADEGVKAAFEDALDKAYARASRLSYKERLAATLKGDPERITYDVPGDDGSAVETMIGKVDVYLNQLAEYEADLKKANQAFEFDHLAKQWSEISELQRELVTPIIALDAELKENAQKILSIEQGRQGLPPEPWTTLRTNDMMVITGLTVLGVLLIIGFATRISALGGAIMVLSFYLVWPPWPGVIEAPGNEHSFIVNKNLIEVAILLAIAAMPTGTWFGIDGIIGMLFTKCCGKKSTSTASGKSQSTGSEVDSDKKTAVMSEPSAV
ncbi:DoxX family protein [Calycomorphotria hydatis]|uniref:DoxX family protein n=1 Tax=Calycomorphotria hydatis TaxID=2528027 RepID=UPI0011A02527|nr:DoxX family protein [Calycomorphotria hydatis]